MTMHGAHHPISPPPLYATLLDAGGRPAGGGEGDQAARHGPAVSARGRGRLQPHAGEKGKKYSELVYFGLVVVASVCFLSPLSCVNNEQ